MTASSPSVGPSVVALVTGEERIVPDRTQYWVCTVEAMPLEIGADFVAVDEIQLCADADRGHVFTDRLLRARGLHETLFLGSDTMRGAIAGAGAACDLPEARPVFDPDLHRFEEDKPDAAAQSPSSGFRLKMSMRLPN